MSESSTPNDPMGVRAGLEGLRNDLHTYHVIGTVSDPSPYGVDYLERDQLVEAFSALHARRIALDADPELDSGSLEVNRLAD